MGTCEYCGRPTYYDTVNLQPSGGGWRYVRRHDDERALTVEACPARPSGTTVSTPECFYVVSGRKNLYMAGPMTYADAHVRRNEIGHGSHVVTERDVTHG